MSMVRSRPHSRRRDVNPPLNQPRLDAPVVITGVLKAGSTLTLTFDKAVTLRGVPQILTNLPGVTPVSAAQPSPNSVAITYSASILAAANLVIPHRDGAIRSARGGYVVSNTFDLP